MRRDRYFWTILCGATLAGPALAASAIEDLRSPPMVVAQAEGEEPPVDAPAGPYDAYVPDPSDPPLTTGDTPPDTGLVKRLFALGFAEQCAWGLQWADSSDPEVHDLTFREASDEDAAPDRPMRIYRFDCDAGAYNLRSVWMMWDGDWGLRPLSFAVPEFAVEYTDADDVDAAVKSITISGMGSTGTLTNTWYDAETRAIHSFALWRGLGDAFDTGVWQQSGSAFVLKSFDVDASYDSEQNPERLVAYPGARPWEPMKPGANGDGVE
jgi:hypothetical protein